MSAADGTPRLGWLRSTARNANSHTTLIVRPKPLALRLMPRRSASACGRAWSRRTSAASGSCWNCSSTASSSPAKLLRSVTQSPSGRRASASRFVDCEQTIKRVFQAHGADATGRVVFRKRLVRAKVLEFFAGQAPCLVALEACGGAHYWARELGKLGPHGAADPTRLREALRQAAEE